MIRFGTYVLFNPVLEGLFWAGFRAFGRVAPQAALKSLMGGLTCLPIDQVLSTMSPDQQQAARARTARFATASRGRGEPVHRARPTRGQPAMRLCVKRGGKSLEPR